MAMKDTPNHCCFFILLTRDIEKVFSLSSLFLISLIGARRIWDESGLIARLTVYKEAVWGIVLNLSQNFTAV